jgi:hypothetical protein
MPFGVVLDPINLLSKVFQWFFPWGEHQPWYVADQTLPTTAEVKNGYHYLSNDPCKIFSI